MQWRFIQPTREHELAVEGFAAGPVAERRWRQSNPSHHWGGSGAVGLVPPEQAVRGRRHAAAHAVQVRRRLMALGNALGQLHSAMHVGLTIPKDSSLTD